MVASVKDQLLHPQSHTTAPEGSCRYNSRVPLWLKVAWTIALAIWAPVYWMHYGAQNFLYFCDVGNILIGVALWTESALIFSWQATGLLLFQTLFVVDLCARWLFRHHLIGGTEYMFDASIPLWIRCLSLFHIITPPLLLWGVWRLGYDPRGWKLQTITTCLVVPINYFWRPAYDVNFARGLFFQEQHLVPAAVYVAAYLIVVPLVVYWPTHRLLQWWTGSRSEALMRRSHAK